MVLVIENVHRGQYFINLLNKYKVPHTRWKLPGMYAEDGEYWAFGVERTDLVLDLYKLAQSDETRLEE